MVDKNIYGMLAVALTIIGYAPYFISILKRQTKPHMFSWIIWSIVNAIASAGQWSRGGGPGSWSGGLTTLFCILITGFCFSHGEKHVTRSDWWAFIAALLAIPLWYFTDDPLGAMILATLIDIVGCYPTLRKSYWKPYEENVFSWAICGVRSLLALFALEKYDFVTVIFLAAMLVTNGGIAVLLLWRRRTLLRRALAR